ncbi:hypothetical protein AGMMS49992_27640 [Clostridia bacterium]|nr:hypothetical protein AGMMS49992_27640 [Clostridia bacterium]
MQEPYQHSPHTQRTVSADMRLAQARFGSFFSTPDALPISFCYAGSVYRGLPADSKTARRFLDANILETVFTGRIGALMICAECLTYRDFPVVEWTVYFSAEGCKTEILSDVWAADVEFSAANAALLHNNGDFYSAEGYTETLLPLTAGTSFAQSPEGGRACDHALPYQRLMLDDGGINIAIGWPAQWRCKYTGAEDSVHFCAGQETSHTYIAEGETFRTPRMTLMAFAGDSIRGANLWRRFMNAHVIPRTKGDVIAPKSVLSDNGGGIEFTAATEKNQLDAIEYANEHFPGTNLWWIDAGWYPCVNPAGKLEWAHTGTWKPDPERFPNGLKHIGEACKQAGMDFLVWFEPERVRKGSEIFEQHPEWILYTSAERETRDYLLDLTNPACHKWLCETISAFIQESGITVYRQDCNFWLTFGWRNNESEDRQGMVENLYVQAYLAYWDYLLIHNPDLWIDSCASGGRRNDMETMRRSVPLHPTDYGYGYHPINQAFRHTLYAWLPYVRGWAQSWDKDDEYYNHDDYYLPDVPSFDNYKMINGFAVVTGFGSPTEMKQLPEQTPYLKKLLAIWQRFAPLAQRADFYPLTENHRDSARWTVFQFDDPATGKGAIQVLRNNQCAQEAITVYPHAFEENCLYRFENSETGEFYTISGFDVRANGVEFRQPRRSGRIWFYERQANERT